MTEPEDTVPSHVRDRRVAVIPIYHPDRRGRLVQFFRVYVNGEAVMDFKHYPSDLLKGL